MLCKIFIEDDDRHMSKLIPIIVSFILTHDSLRLRKRGDKGAHEYEIDAEANDCNFFFRKREKIDV